MTESRIVRIVRVLLPGIVGATFVYVAASSTEEITSLGLAAYAFTFYLFGRAFADALATKLQAFIDEVAEEAARTQAALTETPPTPDVQEEGPRATPGSPSTALPVGTTRSRALEEFLHSRPLPPLAIRDMDLRDVENRALMRMLAEDAPPLRVRGAAEDPRALSRVDPGEFFIHPDAPHPTPLEITMRDLLHTSRVFVPGREKKPEPEEDKKPVQLKRRLRVPDAPPKESEE